jgi:antirestriction protein ArdC
MNQTLLILVSGFTVDITGHEACHWTRHSSRLARDFGRKQWGGEGYAKEELVAELGSAFLCADLGITPDVRDGHADYLHSLQPPSKVQALTQA